MKKATTTQLSDDDGDGLSSVFSPAASSSFSSGRRWSDVDYRDFHPQSEVEEIPSFRWLMSHSGRVPKPPPEPSEVDWGHLISAQGKWRLKQITANHWVVLVECATSEKRCALVLAPGLEIRWRDEESRCWRYLAGAAILQKVCWLDIRAKVDAADLFPQAACVSVLVFQLLPTAFGLGLGGETQEAWVSVGGRLASERTVRLQPGGASSDVPGGGGPRRRRDGWLEIELGGFSATGAYSGGGEVMVEMGLREVSKLGQAKGGLVVRGVEVRPKHFAAAAGKREGTTVLVSSVLCPEWALPDFDAEPFAIGGCWMLSCWLAPIAVTRIHGGMVTGSESYPDQILQRSYADWVPRDLAPTPLDPESEPKPKTENRTRIAAPYMGFRFGFTRAAP